MSDRFLHLLSTPADYADPDLDMSPHNRLKWAMYWYWESVAANFYVMGCCVGVIGVVTSVTAAVVFSLPESAAFSLVLVSTALTVSAVLLITGKALISLLGGLLRAKSKARRPAVQ